MTPGSLLVQAGSWACLNNGMHQLLCTLLVDQEEINHYSIWGTWIAPTLFIERIFLCTIDEKKCLCLHFRVYEWRDIDNCWSTFKLYSRENCTLWAVIPQPLGHVFALTLSWPHCVFCNLFLTTSPCSRFSSLSLCSRPRNVLSSQLVFPASSAQSSWQPKFTILLCRGVSGHECFCHIQK